ncbi:hypothetical protein DWB61_13140 [Ancylomarina euxinus]|uniref:Fibrobacter succinogenes major paralogous domain-containing protein n=1 Tax=Ancylomarina euxinus TaxID=2283627 RepID=A0A425XYR3_9BACT|nr:fibrobacter succinogenes major paralogous domain-containing protein [Ancylomarina euxinus]MCZ4695652.1 fibrobacter succinogenes major paralogous domain-containing protein [Ancylomarina euxinus]MUP16044.1 hypothetical protein [Ancylomarina euxinus]RRG20288.1 hypothetical protein DWB61_13140 [Ancylomarina euxinus]
MKNILSILLITSLLSSVFIACEKDDNKPNPPEISNVNITAMTYQNVTLIWNVTLDSSDEILENGICWSNNSNPTIENNKIMSSEKMGEQNLKIEDLDNNEEIFVRAYSTTEYETTYSDELSFTLWLGAPGEPVTDIDGNAYKTVKIGNQVWMLENLQVKHYNNGDEIPLVTLDEDQKWLNTESGMYCKYEDNDNFGDYYGFLYNGYAVTDERKIAPEGYNIPSYKEWNELYHYLGHDKFPYYMLMEFVYQAWDYNKPYDPEYHLRFKDLSNFGGLPGGWRFFKDENSNKATAYSKLITKAIWWSKSGQAAQEVSRIFEYRIYKGNQSTLITQVPETAGLSIRCIKDSE